MDKQNTSQLNSNGHNNNRRPDNSVKPQVQDKRAIPERNSFNDRNRNQNGGPGQFKPKDQKPIEKTAVDSQNKEKPEQQRFFQQNKFARSNPPKPLHEPYNKVIKVKREDSVEDIQADVERVEKDIQFEIKQVKSIKLGL